MPRSENTSLPDGARATAPASISPPPPGLDAAEAVVVEHYPRLVRLAYLTLPPTLGRHRRVLLAHALVQRALPRQRGTGGPRVPAQRGTDSPVYAWVRERVLHDALRHEHTPRWWPAKLPAPRAWRPRLPVVLGLRLFPRAGGTDQAALEQALSRTGAPVRAALALLVLEELTPRAARELLAGLGVEHPARAVRAAAELKPAADRGAETPARTDQTPAKGREGPPPPLLLAAEFDPCTVQMRPADLLRRRQRIRAGAAVAALAVAAGVLVAVPKGRSDTAAEPAGAPDRTHFARALDPGTLQRAPQQEWADTSRVDFTSWPPRGTRTSDSALLSRALRTWAGPGKDVKVTTTAGTSTAPPAQPPRLLYAGVVDGADVVLLHDGVRLVRYAEPASGGGPFALDFARADDADVTTAAAVVVSRTPRGTRYLLAPWIAESTTRDLLDPNTPARDLSTGKDGVSALVPSPGPGTGCARWPALQLRSSERIVEKHAFLVTDLGDLAPAHLTYTPPPSTGTPARQPREATSTAALQNWAHTACSLRDLRGRGVRAVNNWAYAQQALPEGAGRATWVCTRADTWQGPGRIAVRLQLPGPTGAGDLDAANVPDTAACSRFGQHVLAGTRWKAPSGQWYVLAAGSRHIAAVETSGAVTARSPGALLAAKAPPEGAFALSARLDQGGTLAGFTCRAGARC
ncbi:hypothetical protein ABT160_09755 [Streptomyces sp. NPDC001941]|uniref:hypothetical protein n=1 Tax=Streptomyces sp. NPDC001941 TaxID=3154659 RepID=UPI00332F15D2